MCSRTAGQVHQAALCAAHPGLEVHADLRGVSPEPLLDLVPAVGAVTQPGQDRLDGRADPGRGRGPVETGRLAGRVDERADQGDPRRAVTTAGRGRQDLYLRQLPLRYGVVVARVAGELERGDEQLTNGVGDVHRDVEVLSRTAEHTAQRSCPRHPRGPLLRQHLRHETAQ